MPEVLTPEQLERIERNRQDALRRLAEKKRLREERAGVEKEKEREGKKQKNVGEEEELACESCGSINDNQPVGTTFCLDKSYWEAFGVHVCKNCKSSKDEYKLISKKQAKEDYLLPDGDINVLKYIEKENPHHQGFSRMKLYLRSQAHYRSMLRWGTEAKLDDEKQRREAQKFARASKKAKGIFRSKP
ncbi:unnamed protein product [Chrysoparadoxa australica]